MDMVIFIIAAIATFFLYSSAIGSIMAIYISTSTSNFIKLAYEDDNQKPRGNTQSVISILIAITILTIASVVSLSAAWGCLFGWVVAILFIRVPLLSEVTEKVLNSYSDILSVDPSNNNLDTGAISKSALRTSRIAKYIGLGGSLVGALYLFLLIALHSK